MSLRYRKCLGILKYVELLIACLIVSACSTVSQSNTQGYATDANFKPVPEKMTAPKEFLFEPELGRKENIRVFSRSITRTVSTDKIKREREETVDFELRTTVVEADKAKKQSSVVVETIKKEGPVELYDLGYPELGEGFEFKYTNKARVIKAAHFPSNSLFFLPPISLPMKPVVVGDTWSYQGSWVSLRNGLPMSVDMMSILKGYYRCGKAHHCAEIEISGVVGIPEGLSEKANLDSQLSGRILYQLETGSVLWSEVRNREMLKSGDDAVEVLSCTESLLQEPVADRWPWRAQVGCDPASSTVSVVPGVNL